MRTTPTKSLFAMLNWLPTVLLAYQADKFSVVRLNDLSRWHIVVSGHSTILEVNPVALVIIDYLSAEYCLYRGFHFLIPCRDDWNPNTIVPPEVLGIYKEPSISWSQKYGTDIRHLSN